MGGWRAGGAGAGGGGGWGVATRTPHTLEFPLSAQGQSAVSLLRWVSSRGQTGPWSEPASATIAA